MDKYTSGAFASTKYGIYKFAQDIITSLPATIIADGQSASAIIKGNMQQSGTPTPANPIYPTECGDLSSGNYIIPVISGGVTTNVDLSVVQTTRNIRKLVLTGEETGWVENESGTNTFRGMLSLTYSNRWNASGICSHLNYIVSGISSDVEGCSCVNNNLFVRLSKTLTSNLSDFKSYLQQQYSAGTPVCVWYVLATETTGILNDPIRKIGTYADSVSVSAIPTTEGSQTFDIDTTLKPSEVDLTYNGWHMYNDKKYTGGAWT